MFAKGLIFFCLSMIPNRRLKIFFLRLIPGCKISYNSFIGYFNYIKFNELEINSGRIGHLNWLDINQIRIKQGAWIGNLNRIKSVNQVLLKENAIIQARNKVFGPSIHHRNLSDDYKLEFQNLVLGERSELLRSNFVDLTRSVTLGDNVVIGGNGSEFWTHGFDVERNLKAGDIELGDNIFVGSQCIFTPGVKIVDKVIIAPGSVVYKSINEAGLYSSHQLVKKK